MKTLTLVLDSDQGVGTANRFTVNLNESIRGCVHSQLRQVILTGMTPSSDYIYVRSGKLGSNIISSQGFGAFDVVPVSNPFRYERYAQVPRQNEFECGRLLSSIDVALVNPDNTPVALTPSVVITNPDLFSIVYTTRYTDGTSQSATLHCYVPVGTYTTTELAAAIDKGLPDIPLPHIQFSSEIRPNLQLTMNWTTLSSSETIVVQRPVLNTTNGKLIGALFDGIGVVARYDTKTLTTPMLPVTVSPGTYSKEEFIQAVSNALIPVGEAIANVSSAATFTVSLSPSDNIVISLNWIALSETKIFIASGDLFTGVGVTTNFSDSDNIPPISSPQTMVSIPRGAYTIENLVNAIEQALSFTALGITETFKHADFQVSVSPENDLIIQLNWVCSSYGSTIELPAIQLVDEIVLTAQFSDGTTRSTSTTPALHIPAGVYTDAELENAITYSLAPIATALVASDNYNSAVFSTDITNNIVTVNLDWVCSSYSDKVQINATTFIVSLVATNQSIYNDTSGGFYTSPSNNYGSNHGTFDTRVRLPAGLYSKGEIFESVQTQLNAANNGINPAYGIVIQNGQITISITGTYQYTTSNVKGTGGDIDAGFYQTSQNSKIEIKFDDGASGEDLALLGFDVDDTYASVSPTGGNQTPAYVFTASLSFNLCPSFPPTLTSINGVMNFNDGDYTLLGLPPASHVMVAGIKTFTTTPLTSTNVSFTNSTFQQRSTWTFPASVLIPVLEDVVPVLNVAPGNGWTASSPEIIQATPEQYVFKWSIPLAFPQLAEATAALTYTGENALNSIIGLNSGVGEQTFSAVATSYAPNQKQFSWTFPMPLAFPEIASVNAKMEDISPEVGGGVDLAGAETVFNTQQRRFDWTLLNPPLASSRPKATVVVELTTI